MRAKSKNAYNFASITSVTKGNVIKLQSSPELSYQAQSVSLQNLQSLQSLQRFFDDKKLNIFDDIFLKVHLLVEKNRFKTVSERFR